MSARLAVKLLPGDYALPTVTNYVNPWLYVFWPSRMLTAVLIDPIETGTVAL